jgi:hypothetical protein
MKGLENERIHQRVAEFETRRGPLEGLKQIAEDPEYLAEWQERSDAGTIEPSSATASQQKATGSGASSAVQPVELEVRVLEGEPSLSLSPDERRGSEPNREKLGPEPAHVHAQASSSFAPIATVKPKVQLMRERSSSEILARHVAAGEDEFGFLPCLRRGEPVPPAKVAELIGALSQLEEELRGSEVVSRATAHALHRLSLEAQVMLTDAWPGAFDDRMIGAIRKVQEAVERILSGQDVRYYPTS